MFYMPITFHSMLCAFLPASFCASFLPVAHRQTTSKNNKLTAGEKGASTNKSTGGALMLGPCAHCGVTFSPQWRKGTPEKPVLCNACGIRLRRHKNLDNTYSTATSNLSTTTAEAAAAVAVVAATITTATGGTTGALRKRTADAKKVVQPKALKPADGAAAKGVNGFAVTGTVGMAGGGRPPVGGYGSRMVQELGSDSDSGEGSGGRNGSPAVNAWGNLASLAMANGGWMSPVVPKAKTRGVRSERVRRREAWLAPTAAVGGGAGRGRNRAAAAGGGGGSAGIGSRAEAGPGEIGQHNSSSGCGPLDGGGGYQGLRSVYTGFRFDGGCIDPGLLTPRGPEEIELGGFEPGWEVEPGAAELRHQQSEPHIVTRGHRLSLPGDKAGHIGAELLARTRSAPLTSFNQQGYVREEKVDAIGAQGPYVQDSHRPQQQLSEALGQLSNHYHHHEQQQQQHQGVQQHGQLSTAMSLDEVGRPGAVMGWYGRHGSDSSRKMYCLNEHEDQQQHTQQVPAPAAAAAGTAGMIDRQQQLRLLEEEQLLLEEENRNLEEQILKHQQQQQHVLVECSAHLPCALGQNLGQNPFGLPSASGDPLVTTSTGLPAAAGGSNFGPRYGAPGSPPPSYMGPKTASMLSFDTAGSGAAVMGGSCSRGMSDEDLLFDDVSCIFNESLPWSDIAGITASVGGALGSRSCTPALVGSGTNALAAAAGAAALVTAAGDPSVMAPQSSDYLGTPPPRGTDCISASLALGAANLNGHPGISSPAIDRTLQPMGEGPAATNATGAEAAGAETAVPAAAAAAAAAGAPVSAWIPNPEVISAALRVLSREVTTEGVVVTTGGPIVTASSNNTAAAAEATPMDIGRQQCSHSGMASPRYEASSSGARRRLSNSYSLGSLEAPVAPVGHQGTFGHPVNSTQQQQQQLFPALGSSYSMAPFGPHSASISLVGAGSAPLLQGTNPGSLSVSNSLPVPGSSSSSRQGSMAVAGQLPGDTSLGGSRVQLRDQPVQQLSGWPVAGVKLSCDVQMETGWGGLASNAGMGPVQAAGGGGMGGQGSGRRGWVDDSAAGSSSQQQQQQQHFGANGAGQGHFSNPASSPSFSMHSGSQQQQPHYHQQQPPQQQGLWQSGQLPAAITAAAGDVLSSVLAGRSFSSPSVIRAESLPATGFIGSARMQSPPLQRPEAPLARSHSASPYCVTITHRQLPSMMSDTSDPRVPPLGPPPETGSTMQQLLNSMTMTQPSLAIHISHTQLYQQQPQQQQQAQMHSHLPPQPQHSYQFHHHHQQQQQHPPVPGVHSSIGANSAATAASPTTYSLPPRFNRTTVTNAQLGPVGLGAAPAASPQDHVSGVAAGGGVVGGAGGTDDSSPEVLSLSRNSMKRPLSHGNYPPVLESAVVGLGANQYAQQQQQLQQHLQIHQSHFVKQLQQGQQPQPLSVQGGDGNTLVASNGDVFMVPGDIF